MFGTAANVESVAHAIQVALTPPPRATLSRRRRVDRRHPMLYLGGGECTT